MIPGLAWMRRHLTVDAFPWLLRDGTTKIGLLAPVCPCGFDWYLATLCPCDNCQNFGERQQVGDHPVFCDDGTTPCEWPNGAGEDGDEPQMLALNMQTVVASNSGKAVWGDPVWTIAGSYLTALRIELTPPFTGSCTAHLFVDGTEVSLAGATIDVVRGEAIYAGYNQLDTATGSCWVRVLVVDALVQLSSVETHEIILRFNYTASGDSIVPNGTTAKHYAIRHALVWDFPSSPTIGAVYKLPFDPTRLNSTWCGVRTDDGVWCFWSKISTGENLSGKVYLGPYSESEVDYVATRWSAIIAALADGCTCTDSCGDGGTFANFLGNPSADWTDVDTAAGDYTASVGGPSSPCYWTLDFGYTAREDVLFRWKITAPDSSISYSDPSTGVFTIPPCTTWQLQWKYVGEPVEWDGDGVDGECFPLHSDVPCAFDGGGSMEGTQTLYDDVSHFGVPANSDELAGFLAWEDDEKSECTAAGGTWDEETLTCILPE